MKKDEILEFIKSCNDQEILNELKEATWEKQINIIDNNDKDIIDKIFEIISLKQPTRISCWAPSCTIDDNENIKTGQTLLDFVDAYLFPRKGDVMYYSEILTSLRDNHEEGIKFDDGTDMTESQYISIIDYIYGRVKSGEIGFEWKW